jgi:TonB family protein
MSCFRIGDRSDSLRRVGIRMFQVVAVALVLATALPVRAADDRAIKSRVAPVYPEIAKRMRIGGVVKIEATVDADGKVTSAKAISGNRLLEVAAEDAVKQWKFMPGSAGSNVNVEVNFAAGQ